MRKIKKSFFTLLEVLVSMGVFSLLMLALMQFFSAAQGVWEKTGNRAELFESAKTAMAILTDDLNCAYYEPDHDSNYQFFSISSSNPSQVVFAARKEDGNTQIFYKWDSSSWKLHRIEKKESEVFTSGTVTPADNWFTRSGKTAWITDMSNTALDDSNCLAENVLYFSISARKKNALGTAINISAGVNDKFPDVIIIEMTLLSSDAHEKLRNRFADKASDSAKDAAINELFNASDSDKKFHYIKSDGTESTGDDKRNVREMLNANTPPVDGNDTNQAILFNGCQRFVQVIPLDRGQND